jgi:hypothetical protein
VKTFQGGYTVGQNHPVTDSNGASGRADTDPAQTQAKEQAQVEALMQFVAGYRRDVAGRTEEELIA